MLGRIFQKNINFCFIDYTKDFNYVDPNKLKNSSRYGAIRPPNLPSEKPVCRSKNNRALHETSDWFKIGKGVWQDCTFSPCLFNLHAENIIQNARLDESQVAIKIA